ARRARGPGPASARPGRPAAAGGHRPTGSSCPLLAALGPALRHLGLSWLIRSLTLAHANHRCVVRPSSYSVRSCATVSESDTSAGATSHHTPAPGRSAWGMTGTTVTRGAPG